MRLSTELGAAVKVAADLETTNVQTIRCPHCQHTFDTSFSVHCKCKGCGVSISIPVARSYYITHATQGQPVNSARVNVPLSPSRLPPKPGSSADLPPAVRDENGQPMKAAPSVNRSDRPSHGADWFADVARRAKEIANETAERVAAGGPIEEGS